MGQRIVRVTNELLTYLFRQGNVIPAEGKRVVVTRGLPADAKLVAASGELYFATDEIALKFESAEWGDTPSGYPIPEFRVEFTEERVTPAQPADFLVSHMADLAAAHKAEVASPGPDAPLVIEALQVSDSSLDFVKNYAAMTLHIDQMRHRAFVGGEPDAPHVVEGK